MIAASAASSLRGRAVSLAQQGKPGFLGVNLANPHDVMVYDPDEPAHTDFSIADGVMTGRSVRCSIRNIHADRCRRSRASEARLPSHLSRGIRTCP